MDAALSLHYSCRYTVKQNAYSKSFPMQVGVRQGCALAPTIYSLFTVLFYRELAKCTSQAWAEKCLTIFPDDKHLHWQIESTGDLQFVCHCVQQTFRLLRQYGMTVNSDKSRLVVALRT
ncbi:unnamed protein product [Symbiodinium natans]|uniref:Reverse transcriptase domain-containing protein n=1 Tax=Symbiodinium natans TaxID=878477 RepID=A0A812HZH7_9DINO|nr:unnamed protein product [Symbiodinium natans]